MITVYVVCVTMHNNPLNPPLLRGTLSGNPLLLTRGTVSGNPSLLRGTLKIPLRKGNPNEIPLRKVG